MEEVARSSSKSPTIDRRLWRIDRGDRELVAERHRTVNGRFRTVWLVPEETCVASSGSRLSRKHRAIRHDDPSAL